MTDYKVDLEIYNGPLDLLLYLIRREEIDIHDIPIARITEQYLGYVDLLKQLDPEAISEFLVLAATLVEIKSRTLLPRVPVEVDEEEDLLDPRQELVRQLLAYKKFKDAAHALQEAAETQKQRYARSPVLPMTPRDEIELDNLEIWDLFDAFNGLLEAIGRKEPVHEVGVDHTPIALHADDIMDSIQRAGGTQPFQEIFLGRARPEMIGLFLALLELIKQRRVRASQDEPFAPILLHLLSADPIEDEPEVLPGELEEAEAAEVEKAEPTGGLEPSERDPDDDNPRRGALAEAPDQLSDELEPDEETRDEGK